MRALGACRRSCRGTFWSIALPLFLLRGPQSRPVYRRNGVFGEFLLACGCVVWRSTMSNGTTSCDRAVSCARVGIQPSLCPMARSYHADPLGPHVSSLAGLILIYALHVWLLLPRQALYTQRGQGTADEQISDVSHAQNPDSPSAPCSQSAGQVE